MVPVLEHALGVAHIYSLHDGCLRAGMWVDINGVRRVEDDQELYLIYLNLFTSPIRHWGTYMVSLVIVLSSVNRSPFPTWLLFAASQTPLPIFSTVVIYLQFQLFTKDDIVSSTIISQCFSEMQMGDLHMLRIHERLVLAKSNLFIAIRSLLGNCNFWLIHFSIYLLVNWLCWNSTSYFGSLSHFFKKRVIPLNLWCPLFNLL